MWTCSSVHLGACLLLLSCVCVSESVCDNIVATFRRVGGRGATIGDGMGATVAGFDDSLQRRNRALLAGGAAKQPSAKKTGTTIAGVVYKVPFQRTSEKCGNWFGGGALLLPAAPRSRLECPSGRVLSPLLQLKKRWSAFVFSFRFFLSVFLCFQSVTDSGSRSMLPASLCVIVWVCVCVIVCVCLIVCLIMRVIWCVTVCVIVCVIVCLCYVFLLCVIVFFCCVSLFLCMSLCVT